MPCRFHTIKLRELTCYCHGAFRTSAACYENVPHIARSFNVSIVDHAIPKATLGNNPVRR